MTVVQILKKSGILIAGLAVIVIGVILLPLPGPGLLIIAFGLFILSTEFDWADKYFKMIKSRSKDLVDKTKRKDTRDDDTPKS